MSLFKLVCFLSNHQAVEEGAVALQGLAEIFSRDIISLDKSRIHRDFVGKKRIRI
jgi:hypothetical protein